MLDTRKQLFLLKNKFLLFFQIKNIKITFLVRETVKTAPKTNHISFVLI
jgi:hypothetical protein